MPGSLKLSLALLPIIPLIWGIAVWVDSRYAYATELQQFRATTERTLVLMQLNSLEDRILREESKPEAQWNHELIFRLKNEHRRLEQKYLDLQ